MVKNLIRDFNGYNNEKQHCNGCLITSINAKFHGSMDFGNWLKLHKPIRIK